MTMQYSETNHAMYNSILDYSELPDDVQDVSDEDYKSYWLGSDKVDGYHLKENTYPFVWEEDAIA